MVKSIGSPEISLLIGRESALGTMNQAAQSIIDKKIRVWVMPEGTRSKGRGLLPFKKGAFHMASQTKTPIIPICMSSYHDRLSLNSLKKTFVKIRYLDPIDPSEFLTKEVAQVKDEAYEFFKKELALLDQRTLALSEQKQ